MQAHVRKQDEIFIIDLIGRVDIESADPFRKACQKFAQKRVVFNFQQLSFVGSHGIVPFIEAIQDLVLKHQSEIRFCGVASEFQRIIEASEIPQARFFTNTQDAVQSFSVPVYRPPIQAPVAINGSSEVPAAPEGEPTVHFTVPVGNWAHEA